MNIFKKTLFVFVLVLPVFVFAQEGGPSKNVVPPVSQAGTATGNFMCSDYVRPESVQVDLRASTESVNPGSEITFSGKARNKNSYPLSEGKLQVKIFRIDNESFERGDGDALVDQFVIRDTFSLRPQSEKEVSVSWTVPEGMPAGRYYAATTLTLGGYFPVLDSPVSDGVTGKKAEFSVAESTNPAAVYLDKGGVTLNGQDYRFAGAAPRFAVDEQVTIQARVVNPTGDPKMLRLSWKEYVKNSLRSENERNQKMEVIELAPYESKDISYQVSVGNAPFSYVLVESEERGAHSFLNIRFERENAKSQLLLAGIQNFPLKAGETQEIFGCAKAIGTEVAIGGILTLSLWDTDGKNLYTARMAADAPKDLGGWKSFFTPESDLSEVTLRATLEQDGMVIEEATVAYGCGAAGTCEEEQVDKAVEEQTGTMSYKQWAIGLIVGLLAIALLVIVISRARRKRPQF